MRTNDTDHPLQASGCFARGTPVHTRDGLKPIEEIHAGDFVISSPEDGSGTPDYKRVVNTFVHHGKSICQVNTYGPASGTQYFLATTGNHPFWVQGVGWTRADQLEQGAMLRRVDGSETPVVSQWPVYRTDQAGVGWVQELSDLDTSYGTRFDYERFKVVPPRGFDYLAQDVYDSEDRHLRITVYNLEVEDYHTYYVGVDGIWVRDVI